MAIIGVASIRVRPDLTKFRRELDGELRRINVEFKVPVTVDTTKAERQIRQFVARMNGLDVKIDPDVDGSRIRQATRDLTRFRDGLSEVGRVSGQLTQVLARNTARIAALSFAAGSAASTLSGTASVVGGLGTAIVGMGAAAVGVGVAGLTAMAALSATVKLATTGMGDAFKAVAEGDAKALQEALKNMAPAAREFVTETAKLKPVLDKIRLDTQTALFKDLGTEVLQTGRALSSTFGTLFVDIAKQVNFAAKDVTKFLREARTVKDIEGIADNVAGGFREVSAAARPIVQIIIDIVKSATALLPDMGRSIENVAKKFAAFIRVKADSGELTQFFRNGIETVKQFGRILRDFGVGIANIFRIGSDTGGGFLNILERMAKSFRDFTESASGQSAIKTLFETIRTLSDAFGDLLSTLRPVLGPLGEFAKVVSEGLAEVLNRIGPKLRDTLITLFEKLTDAAPSLIRAFEKMAEAILDVVDALAPLLPALASLVEKFVDISGPSGVAAVALIALLGTKMGLVVAAGVGLGLVLIEVGKGIKSFVNQAGDDIENFGKDMQKLGGPFSALGRGIEIFGSGVGTDPGKVRDFFRERGHDIGHTLLEGISSGIAKANAELLVPGVNGAVNSILSLINGRRSEFEKAGGLTWAEVGKGITSEQQAVVSRLTQAAQALLNLLTGKQPDFASQGKSFAAALANGLTTGQQEVINRIRTTIDGLLGALTGKRQSFDQEGRAISQRLGGGISAGQQDAVNAARNAVNAVIGVFGGVSLYGEGASIIASLKNGIVSGIQAVKNVLNTMTSLIPTWKGPEDVDRKLLVPAGKAIMQGLIKSIESEIPTLRATLGAVTGEVTGAFTTNPSVNARSYQSVDLSSSFEPTPVVVTINTNEGALAGFINGEISANNRTIKRFGMAGATS